MRRVTRTAWALGVVVLTAALGCGSSGYGGGSGGAGAPAQCTTATAQAVTRSIELAGMAFVPACAKVAAGTTVTFTNDDSVTHTVTTDAGQPESFDSGGLAQGGQFTHTFATAGTVQIHCTIHPGMRLTVFVQ